MLKLYYPSRLRDRENGFTLIELLIVVLIVTILAAIAIPVYLGIQNNAHKSAIKADVNNRVKQVQIALTEGGTVAAQYGTKNGSDKGSTVTVQASTTSGASPQDFMVVGTEATTGTPAGAVNFTYTYDSYTGQFTSSDTSSAQASASPTATNTTPAFAGTVVCKTAGNCLVTADAVKYKGEWWYGFNTYSGSVSVASNGSTQIGVTFINNGDTSNVFQATPALYPRANSVVNGPAAYYVKLDTYNIYPNTPGTAVYCMSLRPTVSSWCNTNLSGSDPGYGVGTNSLDMNNPVWQVNNVQTVDYMNYQNYNASTNTGPFSVQGSCFTYASSTYGYLLNPGSTNCAGTAAGQVIMYGGSYPVVAGKTYTISVEAAKYNGNGTPTALGTVCLYKIDGFTGNEVDDCTSQTLSTETGSGTATYQTLTWTYTPTDTASASGNSNSAVFDLVFAKPAGSATTSRVRLGQFSITANN